MRWTSAAELAPLWPLLFTLVAAVGCARPPAPGGGAATATLDEIAESYVRLVLAVGEHDDGYVDAYYGPPQWRQEAAGRSLEEIAASAEALLQRFPDLPPETEEVVRLRRAFLHRQLEALLARVAMLRGERFLFDDESRALYDAVAPVHAEAELDAVLAELDAILAEEGFEDGSLVERYGAFRGQFVIPPDRVDAVFRAAVDACRERTAEHLELPAGESFEVEYVTDKPWSAYNWYQGGYHSLIQVNTELPIYVDRALDLACHEGYPGHHVYNALLEKNLVRDRGWVEYQVYPLYSPQSLIAEGTANFGIEMAFPGEKRLRFERDVLFPLAGLDPEGAVVYDAVRQLVGRLGYADNEAARRYLDGEIDAEAAADWLVRHAVSSPERAAQRVRFIHHYRSYVINYNLGLDLVRGWVDRRLDADDPPEARWRLFDELLSTPRLPSGLVEDAGTAPPAGS